MACLLRIPSLSDWTRPWFYGQFLEAAGPPAPSRLAVIVTVDDEESAQAGTLDPRGDYLASLAAAIQALGPRAMAFDIAGVPMPDLALPENAPGYSRLDPDPAPTLPLVLAGDFRALKAQAIPLIGAGREAHAEPGATAGGQTQASDLDPILARSLYPHLDASGALSLRLPRGEGLGLPGNTGLRSATAAFTGPLAADGPAYRFPAFAGLERGVVAGLGVETARRMLGVPATAVTYVEGVGILFDPAHILPVDRGGNMLLRFHETAGLPSIPASRILDGTVRPGDIQGKAVFVAAKGKPPVLTVAGYLSPAEIWATTASNLLERATVAQPAWGGILAVSLGAALSAILLAVHFADLGLLSTLLLAAVLSALYPLLSVILFVKSSWWLPPELPAFMVLGSWLPFGITRMLSPRRGRHASRALHGDSRTPIRPAPVYDPLIAMGGGPARPAAQASPDMPPAPVSSRAQASPSPAAPNLPGVSHSPRATPPRGIPQTPPPAMPPGSFAPAPPQGQGAPPRPTTRPPGSRERQGPILPASASPPAQAAHSLPEAPRSPSPPIPQDAAAPGADAFRDPRDPPIIGGPAALAPQAPQVPRPSIPPSEVSRPPQPAMPHPHSGSILDEIERDSKGGLVRVGKYRIVRKMGFGSGGDVFEGFDTHMGRKVAIKTITKEAAAHFDRAAERFVIEAKAAGSLNHPCINTIYDFGSIREVSYMVLEYLDGVTLSQWMRQSPVPSPRGVGHWIRQICGAMDYAHSQKVIHRDLKPANLMVVHEGATIKLLDFGIAKLEDVGLTQTGMTVGTPSYMSPEQLTGSRISPASDQYSLAVVLYQLFTYKLPYQGTKIPELCNRILKNDLIPITDVNPSLGPAFWEVLRKAMSKLPEDRYPNCMALCQALEAASPAPQTAPV